MELARVSDLSAVNRPYFANYRFYVQRDSCARSSRKHACQSRRVPYCPIKRTLKIFRLGRFSGLCSRVAASTCTLDWLRTMAAGPLWRIRTLIPTQTRLRTSTCSRTARLPRRTEPRSRRPVPRSAEVPAERRYCQQVAAAGWQYHHPARCRPPRQARSLGSRAVAQAGAEGRYAQGAR
jgi:hypothetical protein